MNQISMLSNLEIAFWRNLILLMENRRLIRRALLFGLLAFVVFVGLIFSAFLDNLSPFGWGVGGSNDDIAVQIHEVANSQYNLLIIVVDQLAKPKLLYKSELRGLWLVASLSSSPQLTFLPLYPNSLNGGLEADINLAGKFAVKMNSQPATEFLDYLRSKEIRFDDFVIIDETALVNLVEIAEGVQIEPGGLTDNPEIIERLILGPQQPQGLAVLASAICNRSWFLFQGADVFEVKRRISGHMTSDITWPILLEIWDHMQTDGESFTCDFPTLSVEVSSYAR